MPRDQLLGLVADVDRLLAAGATAAVGNDNLSRRGRTLRELGQKVAALQPVAAAVERVSSSSSREVGRAFLDLVVIARQLRGSLAGAGPEGPLQVLSSSDSWQTPMPARDVYNAHEALTADASSSVMKDAVEREVTGDLRLLPSALAALESNKTSIADLMADKVLPAIGRGVLPDLLTKLDLKGKTADARRLRAVCKIDPKIGAELCRKALSEGSPPLIIQALNCLPDVGLPGEAEKVGLEMWKGKKKEVRVAALRALRKATSDEALEVLIQALSEDDLQILDPAQEALAALPSLQATERLLREVEERTANLAPPAPKPKKGAKKEAQKEAEKAEQARNKAIATLGQVVLALGGRRDAQNARVLKTLLALAHHAEAVIRTQAVQALAKLGPDVKEVMPVLIEAVGDSDGEVAVVAILALSELPPEKREAAIPTLLKYAADCKANGHVVYNIVGMLPQHMNHFGDQILDLLRHLLKGEYHLMPAYAINALSEIGPPARKLLPDILEHLKSGGKGSGACWVEIFAKIESEGTTSIPALIQLLGERMASVRAFALQGLTGYGPKAQSAEPVITKLLKDRDWSVKYAAQSALAVIKGER